VRYITIITISLLVSSCSTSERFPSRIAHKASIPSEKASVWIVDNAPDYIKEEFAKCKLDAFIANKTNDVSEPTVISVTTYWDKLLGIFASIGAWFLGWF